MPGSTIQMIMNQPLSNIEEYLIFKGLIKNSCEELNISQEDEAYNFIQQTQMQIETKFEELSITLAPKKRKEILLQIMSYRNQLCTQLHQRYINSSTDNQSDTFNNLSGH